MCLCHKSAVCGKKLDGALRIENKCSNDLINLGSYATMNTREGGFIFSLKMLIWGRMWRSKVARRGENLVQYLKFLRDIVLDAKTFDNQAKAYLQASLQGRSRRLLREPLPVAKKRKAPP